MWVDCLLALKDNPKYSMETIIFKDEAGNEYPVKAIIKEEIKEWN